MKSKIVESMGYMSIALILALTLVLSFSVIDFNSNVTAYAAAPSDNTLYIYPGSTSVVAEGYDYSSTLLYDGTEEYWNEVVVPLTVSVDSMNYDDSLYQYIFYVETYGGDMLYLDGVNYYNSNVFGVAGDHGFSDLYFVFSLGIYSEDSDGNANMSVYLHQELDDYSFYSNVAYVYVYDIRVINTNSGSSSTADNFFSIVGDGISFGFESIAGGITYTVDNLFFEDGNLTDFSVIIFAMTGVSLALAIIKYIMRIIFSFGGIKL